MANAFEYRLSGRSRAEITRANLQVVATGNGRRLRIMYGAYLSYGQLEEYADFMIREELVYREGGSGLYRLTRKGESFLRQSEQHAGAPRVPD